MVCFSVTAYNNNVRVRDLLSVEILCHTVNHELFPAAKALQSFGCGHLYLNMCVGFGYYW